MPTVITINGYRFYFFSQDANEPIHIHVEKQEKDAKLWIDTWEFVNVHGFKKHELNRILSIAKNHENEIRNRWNEHAEKQH